MSEVPLFDEQIRGLEQRPWGCFRVIGDYPDCKIKRLDILPGQRLSLQSHRHRTEYWVMIRGTATVTLAEEQRELQPGEMIVIPKTAKHRIENGGHDLVSLIEVQLGSYFGEDDIVRYADDYQRT
ncbi:Phosphomannose isomerase type II C-terminal cupin domain [Sulfidibacter corallicola]|uniref:Phosphomannose isomerase type II C-terminal cupin domain n=1 Tax=Sulfidibacter corallicola TaxID=2818388 RepID=A0A8A4TM18_SULCO|nr:phosphomannose isomerase type II C-terminal cupin domain [Sulfidibacter corallicola]QTD47645.1 phosphomannose isomerase type II C-terminal cupin domain [Sulfidibacter corallicola]